VWHLVHTYPLPTPTHTHVQDFLFLFDTLGKYQEQPMLLASALQDMVDPLTSKLLQLIQQGSTSTSTSGVGRLFLDKHLSSTVGRTFDEVCKVLQLICRVRGYKHVMKLFPHEVGQLEPCLFLLVSHRQAATYGTNSIGEGGVVTPTSSGSDSLYLNAGTCVPSDMCAVRCVLCAYYAYYCSVM